MIKSLQKLVSELPEGANVTITNYQCNSKQEAENFVRSLAGEDPIHDSLYGTAWCLVTFNNVEVVAYYDSEEVLGNDSESL